MSNHFTVNQDSAVFAGTSLQGYVTTTYAQLAKTFGQPYDYGDGKTRAEWDIVFEDGTVATVYDWKCYEPIEDVAEWNIGGHDGRAVELVKAVLRDAPKPARTVRRTVEVTTEVEVTSTYRRR